MRPDAKQSPSEAWIAELRARFPTERTVDAALTRKLRRRAGPGHLPQSPASVVERLERFLGKRIGGPISVSEVRPLAGGSSKEQFAFHLAAEGHDGDFVLRLDPAASIVETHRLREFQATRALAGVMPTAPAVWCDPEGEELGQSAIVSVFRPGVTKPPSEGPYKPRQGLGPRYRALLAPQFVSHMAALGAFDWRSEELDAFDRPPDGSSEGVLWAINGWRRVWEEDAVEAVPLVTLAYHWLRENAPPIDRVSLVHGDFRAGNFLFDPETAEITAMLDWEMVHLGDRHEDLAFLMSPLFEETDEDGQVLVGGLCRREALIADYQRLSGLPVDEDRLGYYRVFTAWRSVIITLATAARCVMGAKTHQDIRVAWIANTGALSLQELHAALKERP
jgi:aminoglycoside phosphotransferase (APT) family kinase protein